MPSAVLSHDQSPRFLPVKQLAGGVDVRTSHYVYSKFVKWRALTLHELPMQVKLGIAGTKYWMHCQCLFEYFRCKKCL